MRNWGRRRACTRGHAVRRIHTRSVVYSVHGRAKVQNCMDRKECAASRLHVRETSVLHSASGLPRYLPACRNVAANRRVLAHWCKIIEACKCKQRFSVRCLYALRSHLRVHQTEVPAAQPFLGRHCAIVGGFDRTPRTPPGYAPA